MYSQKSLVPGGLGPGRRSATLRSHQEVHRHYGMLARPQHDGNFTTRNVYEDAARGLARRHAGSHHEGPSGMDFVSALRNVFDQATAKGASAPTAAQRVASAATATASGFASCAAPAAAATSTPAAATAAVPPVPPGPYASIQMPAAASSAPSDVQSILDSTLAQQVLMGQGAVQDDPVAAARQLQMFLTQYRDQYGPETDVRIGAAVQKLQEYIDGYSQQQQAFGAGGVAGAAGEVAGMAGGMLDNGTAAEAVSGAASAGGAYHNYILEQLTGVLDWVNSLLVRSNPRPYVFDAYGRVVEDAGAAEGVVRQQEQLRAASSSLRMLIQQLQQVNQQYSPVADADERAAMGQVLSQLTTMADRLAVAAARKPMPPLQPPSASSAAAAMSNTVSDVAAAASSSPVPYIRPEHLYGADSYRDPLLRVLDGIYSAVVVDSGLREFLAGVKQLGDSLAASMAGAWTGAPPIGRLIAYMAAVAGVLFVMRTRLPRALLAPTKLPFRLQLPGGVPAAGAEEGADSGADGSDGDGAVVTPWQQQQQQAAAAVAANPAAAAAFSAISSNSNGSSDGPATAAAAAAAFAAIASSNGGNGSSSNHHHHNPWTDAVANAADSNGAVGGYANANGSLGGNGVATQPAAATQQQQQLEGFATGSNSGSNGNSGSNRAFSLGMGNGWAMLTGGPQAPTASASAAPSGLFTSAAFPGARSATTQRQHNDDLVDWWGVTGKQQQQQQQQQQPATPPAQHVEQQQPPKQHNHHRHPQSAPSGLPTAAAVSTANSAGRQPHPPPSSSPATAASSNSAPRPLSAVAESWAAFRRLHEPAAAPAAAKSPASSPQLGTRAAAAAGVEAGGGGVLDTTAALAAAAVAAAALRAPTQASSTRLHDTPSRPPTSSASLDSSTPPKATTTAAAAVSASHSGANAGSASIPHLPAFTGSLANTGGGAVLGGGGVGGGAFGSAGDRAALRASIKERLRWVCAALGPVSSVVPGGEPLRGEVDALVMQLEALGEGAGAGGAATHPAAAASPRAEPGLLGEWQLVYASNAPTAAATAPGATSTFSTALGAAAAGFGNSSSSSNSLTPTAANGPNLLSQLLHVADNLPGFGMSHVVQRITLQEAAATAPTTSGPQRQPRAASSPSPASAFSFSASSSAPAATPASASSPPAATLVTENSAVFRFGPLGSWKVTVRGTWLGLGQQASGQQQHATTSPSPAFRSHANPNNSHNNSNMSFAASSNSSSIPGSSHSHHSGSSLDRPGGSVCAAVAEFESFSVQPVELWGLPVDQLLPEVVVPLPEVLRSRAEWS
ncbi:hypothetical protein Agub_g5049, partial [Astrephomene gubernaculifera]